METLIFLLGVAALVVVNALVAFLLGYVFTEVVRLPLRFKPFTCRPCLTFWFTVVLAFVLALFVVPYFPGVDSAPVRTVIRFGLISVGALMGLISYLYIKLKFRIYD